MRIFSAISSAARLLLKLQLDVVPQNPLISTDLGGEPPSSLVRLGQRLVVNHFLHGMRHTSRPAESALELFQIEMLKEWSPALLAIGYCVVDQRLLSCGLAGCDWLVN